MIRIICTECKNAYLCDEGDKLVCPSCKATYTEDIKNLLLGIQYYNEGNYSEADNCFMKYIVKSGTEPIAIFYKALCDARNIDEDTLSISDTYKKILNAFDDVCDEDYPRLIALANDEAEKIEKSLTEIHIRLFADADAEKIKKQVETILNIQKEAKDFRTALNELVFAFNERSPRKISAKFSDCFFVDCSIASEVGDLKYQKICDNIAAHTVFTGILTNDIKNLEIYFRCVVMFFQKSHDKYEFLLEQANKFIKLAEILELGQYNTIKGTETIADKLKTVSYEFLQESYKEHFDEQIDTQTETVVVIEPEIIEEEIATEEASENDEVIEEIKENVEEDSTEVIDDDSNIDTDIIEIEVEEAVEETVETEIVDISSTTEIDEKIPEEETETIEETDDAIVEVPVEIEEEENSEEVITEEEISEEETEIIEEIDDAIVEVPVEIEEESSEEVISEEVITEEETVEDVVETEEVVLDNCEKIEADDAVINGDDQKHKVAKPKKKTGIKALVLLLLIVVLAGILTAYKYVPEIINQRKYDEAAALAQKGSYTEAITAFKALGDYSDSAEKATECEYNLALKLEEEGKFAEAKAVFEALGDYNDSKTRVQACAYSEAQQTLEAGNYEQAAKLFVNLDDYGNSKDMVKECSYRQALSLMENKEYKSAIEILTAIRKYSDAKDKILEAKYMYVTDNFDKKNKTTVKYLKELTEKEFRNSADLRKELLGADENTSEEIKAFVNYSSADLETSLTQLDNTRSIYFHVIVGDKALYGKTLTLKYTTAFGYSQKETVVLSEGNNSAVMSYPPTQYKNYTVDFELLDSAGQKVAGQKISF